MLYTTIRNSPLVDHPALIKSLYIHAWKINAQDSSAPLPVSPAPQSCVGPDRAHYLRRYACIHLQDAG